MGCFRKTVSAALLGSATVASVSLAATTTAAQSAMANARGRDAVVYLDGNLNGRVVGPMQVSGPFRAVESAKSLRARNLVVRDITAVGLQRDGIRLRGEIDGARVQNFRLAMRPQPQTGPNLPIGIALVSGRGLVVSDGVVRGFRMERVPGKYTNGDGIASERKVHGLTIRNVAALDNSDAGFDLKSSDTRLDGLRAERNGRNYRFWSTVEAGTLTSIDPRGAHVWLSKGANVRIRRLVARSGSASPLIQVEDGATLVVDQCDLRLPRGAVLVDGNHAGVKLGRGCQAGR